MPVCVKWAFRLKANFYVIDFFSGFLVRGLNTQCQVSFVALNHGTFPKRKPSFVSIPLQLNFFPAQPTGAEKLSVALLHSLKCCFLFSHVTISALSEKTTGEKHFLLLKIHYVTIEI